MKAFILFVIVLLFPAASGMAQSMEWLCRPGSFSGIQYMGHDLFKVQSEGKWGIISAVDGKEVLEVKYDSITSYVENRALVLDKTGRRILSIIDQNGEILRSFADKPNRVGGKH